MTEKEEKYDRIVATCSITKQNGVTLTASTVCGSMEFVQKFLRFREYPSKG